MSFWGRIFKRSTSNLSNPTAWLLDILGRGSQSKSGIKITRNDAIKVSAVFACINVISQTVASLPFQLYKHTAQGKEKAREHPLYDRLHMLPNAETTAFDFWLMYLVNLLLCGDGFAVKTLDNSGRITGLYNVPSGNVKIFRNKNTSEIYYEISDDEGNKANYYPENIMHTRGMRFSKTYTSLDPIDLAREALGLSVALEEYGEKFFANGANTGGVVAVPKGLTQPAFDRFKESFNEKYSGIGNSSKVLFLEDGATFTKIGTDPEKAQSIESRKFQVIEIARFFNVPPHKIMDLERATFSNIEQQSIDFVQSCIGPMCVRLEQTVYKDLLKGDERKKYFAKFTLNGLLRGDSAARKDYYQAMVQNGVYSPNDVRNLEDENTYDSGDIYMVNGAMVPVELLKAVWEKKLKEGGAGI